MTHTLNPHFASITPYRLIIKSHNETVILRSVVFHWESPEDENFITEYSVVFMDGSSCKYTMAGASIEVQE